MPNIKDVAREANVAIGTVSKYLNGIEIRNVKKEKIETAIKKLGYIRNLSAKSLKTNKSYAVGVIINDITGGYYPDIIKAIESYLYGYGYSIIIVDSNMNIKIEREKIKFLLEKQIEAFVIFPLKGSFENYQYIINQNIPLCIVDTCIPKLNCTQVITDNIYATYQATSALIEKGHKNIGFIYTETFAGKERFKGYKLALEAHEIVPKKEYTFILGNASSKTLGMEGIKYFKEFKTPPTAVIAYTAQTLKGAVIECIKNNISIPDDIEIVGFDLDSISEIINKPIGIIRQNIEVIAKTAAENILELIESKAKPTKKIIKVQSDYIDGKL